MTVEELISYASYVEGDIIVYGYNEYGTDIEILHFVGVPGTNLIPQNIASEEINEFDIANSNLTIWTSYILEEG